MVDKGFECGIGNGVDGMGANQAVNVQSVRIGRVFYAGRCPQKLDAVGTFFGKCGKFAAAEVLRPILIGGFGQRNGDFAFEVVGQSGVQCGIDTRNKEAGDNLNMGNVMSCLQTFGNAVRVGRIGFEGLDAGEEQGQVDADAV